jgi:hypothetical protein
MIIEIKKFQKKKLDLEEGSFIQKFFYTKKKKKEYKKELYNFEKEFQKWHFTYQIFSDEAPDHQKQHNYPRRTNDQD